LDLAFAILPGVGKIVGDGLNSVQVADDAVELASKANGQWHHVFSTKIMNALNKHELLRGVFKRNDLIVQAADKASHYGYQTWHRVTDNEVVRWLASEKGASASASEFLEYLGSIYGRADMRSRFPDATNIISTALEGLQ
jgi:hypothetical protein